jgi:hypothetical protein
MLIRRIVVCDLSGSAVFSHITSVARFAVIIEHKMRGFFAVQLRVRMYLF